jgi:DNA-directed RNA polymerase specialized sigma24 family protein
MNTSDPGPERAGRSLSPGGVPQAPAHGSLVQVRAEWIRFYDDQYHAVVRFMMLNGATLDEASDAAQEAFTESWRLMERAPGKWQAITGKAGWVRKVALRRHARPPGPRLRPLTVTSGEMPDRAASGPGHAELAAQTQAVVQALRSLGSQARAVMAVELDGFTPAETAAELGITVREVWDLKKTARAALKRHLAAAAAEEGRKTP